MFESCDRVRAEAGGEQTFASSGLEPILGGKSCTVTIRDESQHRYLV